MSVEVQDTSAELCGGSSPGDLRLKLSRLEPPQAAEELKELLFTMAASLSESDRELSLSTFFIVTFVHESEVCPDLTVHHLPKVHLRSLVLRKSSTSGRQVRFDYISCYDLKLPGSTLVALQLST